MMAGDREASRKPKRSNDATTRIRFVISEPNKAPSPLHPHLFAFEIRKRTTPSRLSNTVVMKPDSVLEAT